MRKHVLVLTTSAAFLAYGAFGASAQGPDVQTPGGRQQTLPSPLPPSGPVPNIQQSPSGPVPNIQPPSAVAPRPQQPSAALPLPGQSSAAPPLPRGIIGPWQDQNGRRQGAMGRGTIAPMMARMIFALMDTDGDGKISLQEFQAAHERIFRAMDANKDGFVTFEEMQAFIRGSGTPGQ